ncbi:hypothetical protein [Brevundimonas sp. GCM10030266]|uniref:hypothetical protein n=1 Tax=Brevundimonas sp. GCM10030266 TaxID=3273386 RepID=UPI00361FEF04
MSDQEIEALEARLAELKAARDAKQGEPTPEAPVATVQPVTSSKSNEAKWIIGGAVVFVVVVGLLLLGTSDNGPTPQTSTAHTAPSGDVEIVEPEPKASAEPPSPWVYTRDVDPMDDSVTELACVTSTNEAQLGWPYGNLGARLCIRKTKKWGTDIFIAMNGDAQILCRSYDECRIPTRFGEADPVRYRGTDSADGSSHIAFIADGSVGGFIERLKDADTTRVSLTFYQAGDQVMEFNTRDFQWPVPAQADQ